MPAFRVTKLVRFQHCDPAGIVFYPMYFQLFNEVVEDWFAGGLGTTFREFHLERRLGLPVKKTECEFFAPSRLGDTLDCALQVTRVGGSSVGATIRVTCGDELRAEVKYVLVQMSLDAHKAVAFDDALRARIASFLD
jgi:4-hydroxybenzoyl-CoA thioesterase